MAAPVSTGWHIRALRPVDRTSWLQFSANDLACQTVHTICLFSHFIIIGAGAYGFISCGQDLGFDPDNCSSNSGRVTLPWSVSLMGMLTAAANGFFLGRITKLEKRENDNTSQEQRIQKISTLSIGMVLNMIFMLVDFVMVAKALELAEGRWTHLYIIAVVEGLGGGLLILVSILHVGKLFRVFRQRRQVYEVLNNLEDEFEEQYTDLENSR